jgi:1-acyl-sn-glycerol-3-phosphate acyltransferase
MFVGKLSISKVPFFGYMFKRFHITVDRTKMREKYATYARSIAALKNGFSLAIFPEGGIRSNGTTQMGAFKEGPFRMAIEANTPLVPVTMLDNWHIFPDDGRFNFFRRKCRMIVHDPISPSKYTIDQIKEFQEEVFTKIQTALNQNHQPA